MKLSIITICRNAGDGLRDAVDSVLRQSRLPDDYVIQDGISSDASVARLLDGLQNRECDLRIRSEADLGVYDALNRAISRAKGDVIGLLHAGDVYAHDAVLATVMRAFGQGAEAVYGDLQYVGEQKDGGRTVVRHWRSGEYQRHKLRWGWMPPHPTLFLRRDVYERVALAAGVYFDPAFRCAGDYDLILRLFPLLRVPPVYIPEVFVQMRMGGISNRSVRHVLRKSCEDWSAIRRNRMGGPHTLIAKNLRKIGQFCVSA